MVIILKGFLFDNSGRGIKIGDRVENSKGLTAIVKFGQYEHHIGKLSSPAYGVYFDGDEGFCFSEYLKPDGQVNVRIKSK